MNHGSSFSAWGWVYACVSLAHWCKSTPEEDRRGPGQQYTGWRGARPRPRPVKTHGFWGTRGASWTKDNGFGTIRKVENHKSIATLSHPNSVCAHQSHWACWNMDQTQTALWGGSQVCCYPFILPCWNSSHVLVSQQHACLQVLSDGHHKGVNCCMHQSFLPSCSSLLPTDMRWCEITWEQ